MVLRHRACGPRLTQVMLARLASSHSGKSVRLRLLALPSQESECKIISLFRRLPITEREQALNSVLSRGVCTGMMLHLARNTSQIKSLDSLLLLPVNGDITSFHPGQYTDKTLPDNATPMRRSPCSCEDKKYHLSAVHHVDSANKA